MTDLRTALRALNEAAYAAVRAANKTPMSEKDRQTLYEIARRTDRLFEDNA